MCAAGSAFSKGQAARQLMANKFPKVSPVHLLQLDISFSKNFGFQNVLSSAWGGAAQVQG